ncbi:MAG: FkbM family methyltransferase [Planctomycetota bacterium]
MTILFRSVLKQLARRVLIPRGRKHGLMAMRDRIADLAMLAGVETPIIVDGGANKGEITDLFLRQFKNPIIHAFEPIPALAEQLRACYRKVPNVVVHEVALGEEERQVDFHVTQNLVSSSVLKPSATNLLIHRQNVATMETISVRQTRLDREITGAVDILKLDLQGFELPALRGCGALLPKIKTILLEVEFLPMYEGQALFGDIDAFLRTNGFQLFNFYEIWTRPEGCLESADAIYTVAGGW